MVDRIGERLGHKEGQCHLSTKSTLDFMYIMRTCGSYQQVLNKTKSTCFLSILSLIDSIFSASASLHT